MLCYAHKTVVGPLLALLLGDGTQLIVQVMPPALLEQSKATLRATFSSIVRKRVFTLSFDRSSELSWATVDKLHSAARNRGIVLCTASTVKSIQLKALEKMDVIRDPHRKQHPSMEHQMRALVHGLRLFKRGCLIMDEVDLLLHPLKAELNFPIGDKASQREPNSQSPDPRAARSPRTGRLPCTTVPAPRCSPPLAAPARLLARALDMRHPRA